ncbi:hypothetical protein BP5796_01632 [Coleophoma crateriformis]|uniref:Malic acid transport protein n=1 Tax=Coleophoma crateriformis TaxID=565419 RepID=A0A3D8T2L3_9HELO|nr:hypothetical protein BP5796_01632 [Coleophoma crateriformis]
MATFNPNPPTNAEDPIEELINYKKNVLYDDRRDTRIRGSVEATLEFFNKRRSQFSNMSQGSNSGFHTRSNSGIMEPNHNSPDPLQTAGSGLPARPNMAMFSRPTPQSGSFNSGYAGLQYSNPQPQQQQQPQVQQQQQFYNSSQPSLSRNQSFNGGSVNGGGSYNSGYGGGQLINSSISRPILTSSHNSTFTTESIMMAKEKGDMFAGYAANDPHAQGEHGGHAPVPTHLSIRARLEHFTFAWFACTMSTGGVAFTMSVIPNRPEALTVLGTVMFVANLVLIVIFTMTMITRFILHPHTFTHAFTNPHEGFFFATFWLTMATVITNTTAYGIPNTGPWLIPALRVAFWVYTVIVTFIAILYYYLLIHVKKLVITNVLPGWVLPIFPAMLVGTLASAIGKTQPAEHAFPMLVAGLTFQGLGFLVASMMYAIYFGRLLTSGFPVDASRPAMMIAVGPPAFTALAIIGMAQDVQATGIFTGFTQLNGISPANQALIPDMLSLLAILGAVGLWLLAFWFFALATMAYIECASRNAFHLNWYALVFPNVGFTIATIKIGERLSSPIIQSVGTVMAAFLFFLWILVFFCHWKAVLMKDIMWPGKDEDAAH